MQKRYLLIVAVFLGILGGSLGHYLFESNDLQEELEAERDKNRKLSIKNSFHNELLIIDELLVQGNFSEAKKRYSEILTNTDSAFHDIIGSRIKLSDDIIRMQSRAIVLMDTTTVIEQNKKEVNRKNNINDPIYDSLQFVLVKANVQIENLKRRLSVADKGKYVKFSNAKGYEVYYVGQVVSGKATGEGVALFSSGGRYEGQWRNNQRHGKGVYFWPDGAYYDGYYQSDQRNGLGSYHWPNGEKFTGQWQDGQRNGFGTFYDNEGKVTVKGLWEADEFIEKQK